MSSLNEYGRLLRDNLKRCHPQRFRQLSQSGELMPYLLKRQQEAVELAMRLEDQYLEKNPPDQKDFLKGAATLQQAEEYAREVVLNQLLIPDPEEADEPPTDESES